MAAPFLATGAGRALAAALPAGAMVLSIVTFAGYGMGLARDKMLAHVFGAGAELDAYNAAFVLPELALDVLVAGALIAPFVPLFVGLRDEAAETAREFGRTVLTLAVLVMALASAVLFVMAPQTIAIIVPGFTPEQKDLYIGLFRVMCLTPVIFAASIVVGEVLVAERRLFFYGLAPLMYNGGIAAGAFFLAPFLGIYAAAVGAVAGATAHLAIRLIGLRGSGFRPQPRLALRTKGLGEFVRLMIPKMVSQPLEPLTFLFFTSLASTLAAGSVSSLSFARNFQGVPVSIIGMSFAIAAFPALSAAAAAGDRRAFARVFRTNLISITLFTSVAAIGLFVLSGFVIGLFLGGGRFDQEDVARTALVLAVFAFSVPLESVVQLLARAVYATRDTLLPTAASVVGFIMVVATATWLVPLIGVAAIPAAYTVGMGVRVLVLAGALAIRVAGLPPDEASDASLARLATGAPRVERRRRGLAGQAVTVMAAFLLGAGGLYATGQALSAGASIAAAPVITPWARVVPLASHDVPPLPSIPAASASAEVPGASPTPRPSHGRPSPEPTPTSRPTPTPTPKPQAFEMDLYQKGDFIGELQDTWCVPAALQTSINIMSAEADITKATQTKLFHLAYSIAPGSDGGADLKAWPAALEQLGYGNFAVGMDHSMVAAVHQVAKAIRLTNRPAGLIVWYGWHSWVVSGFKATADPALTDKFTVTGLYIEDVWYDRLSTIWGYSNPPDTFVKVSDLPIDYKRYNQGSPSGPRYLNYLFVVPQP